MYIVIYIYIYRERERHLEPHIGLMQRQFRGTCSFVFECASRSLTTLS